MIKNLDDLGDGKMISKSLSASIFGFSHMPELAYEYLNEPKSSAVETMHSHRGIARLSIEKADRMIGDYFNGRRRAEVGEIVFSRRQ